jgi:hypothetical protein
VSARRSAPNPVLWARGIKIPAGAIGSRRIRGSTTKSVLYYLAMDAWPDGGNVHVDPHDLARTAGTTPRTVLTALKHLHELNLIRTTAGGPGAEIWVVRLAMGPISLGQISGSPQASQPVHPDELDDHRTES